MQQNDRLLEIGCGRGEFLQAFNQLGLNCCGVDLCEYRDKESYYLQVEKIDVSKDTFPFEDNTFNFIYHKSLIEHLYLPDHLMCETYRVLKSGGRVIILTPDWVSQTKVFYEDFTHCRPYDVTSLKDLLQYYGFSGIYSELFYQLPILWRYPGLKILGKLLQCIISTPTARKLTNLTGIKFFRWSVELMVLGTGVK